MSQSNSDIDSKLLAKFGYSQDLNRSMKGFSSFAISFSLISILTGIFANFHFGYSEVGPWISISWLVVFIGQFFVALIMAELSVRFPISGYGYQWSSRLVNNKLGFATGWLLLMQFLTGFPGICKTLGIVFSDFISQVFKFEINDVIISILIIWVITIIHKKGIKMVSYINNIGVITEIIGVVLLILTLGFFVTNGVEDFSISSISSEFSFSEIGFESFALSILLGAWCLTGFEAAADMSEETKNPTKVVPKSIINSLLTSGTFGLIIIVFSTILLQKEIYTNGSENFLTDLLRNEFGIILYSIILLFVIAAIFACGVACMATASRLVFSMSRDSVLPKSNWLKSIDNNKSPGNTLVLIGILATFFIIVFNKIEVITSVSAIAGYIGYCGIIFSSFYLNYNDDSKIKTSKIIKLFTLIWCAFVVLCLVIPGQSIEGFSSEYIPAISTVTFIIIGIIIYNIKK
jgi:amino acid transporter